MKFPILKEYLDNNKYYEADKLVRTEVVNKLKQSKKDIQEIMKTLSSNIQDASLITEFASIETKIETKINYINTAEYGYAGFFASIKIGIADLDRLLMFDSGLIEKALEINSEITQFDDEMKNNSDINKKK